MTPQTFRTKQKELLGEGNLQTGGTPTWTDPQLDSWRDDEIKSLYAKGLYKVGSTRTLSGYTEALIGTTGTRFFTMPTTFRKVYRVQFLDTADQIIGVAHSFDDTEDSGFIRIDRAQDFEGYKLRLVGEMEYTAVDDVKMYQEVVDVCLFGSVVRALVGEYVKRQKANRSRVSTRTTDVSPGAIAAGISVVERLRDSAKADALRIQSTFSFGR